MSALPPDLRRDTVVALEPLDLGRFDVGPGKRLIPICAWLITLASGRRVLLDTGFPPAYAVDERATALADGLDSFGRLVGFGPQHTVLGALSRHGVAASDISLVILSHSHIDHVGGLDQFPGVTIILSAVERALARPLYFGKAQPMAWPKASYIAIDRATDICRGLRLYPTPGHTAGHLSALVRVHGRATVLAIDAINRSTEPAEGYPDAADPVTAARSGRMLHRLARRYRARLVPGHEPIARIP